jgi:hypothetical protein
MGQKLNWARFKLDLLGQDMIVGIHSGIFKDAESEKIIKIGTSWPAK